MQYLTDFADQAVILPSIALLLAAFACLRLWRGVLAWVVVVVAAWGLVLTMKLGFMACGSPLAHELLRSPSGHTMSATVFYGGLLAMLGPGFPLASAIAAGIAALIGASRLALHAHTAPEVLLGGTVGVVAVMALHRLAGPTRRRLTAWPLARRLVLLAVLLIPAMLIHHHRSAAEGWIQVFARTTVRHSLDCHPTGG